MARSIKRERHIWAAVVIVGAVAAALLVAFFVSRRVGVGVSVLFFAAVVVAKPFAVRYANRHLRLLRGAVAERNVGETLDELRSEGWTVMHDIEQRYEGNVDHLVSGPNGVYLVETKYRGYRESALRKARRQAAKLHDELGVWVTPVICLDQRRDGAFEHDRVWVVPRQELLGWLRKQRNRPVQPERLEQFAGVR